MRRPFIFTSLGVVRGESKRGNRKCGPENRGSHLSGCHNFTQGQALTTIYLSIYTVSPSLLSTPWKYWLITQEAMAPSRHDWKIVDWDVKPQHNQPIIAEYYAQGCLRWRKARTYLGIPGIRLWNHRNRKAYMWSDPILSGPTDIGPPNTSHARQTETLIYMNSDFSLLP